MQDNVVKRKNAITDDPDVIVKRIKNIIDENYNCRLTAETIAARISYSKKQTQRIFLKETGKTLHEYLTEVRIQKAKEMISGNINSVSAVSERVGYKNISHFKELFKKYTDCTPEEYKNKEK